MTSRDSFKLTSREAAEMLENTRGLALATNGRDGYPHVVAMAYIVRDGDVLMTSYGKAQKVVNLRRDPRATLMLESGTTYNTLKGLMIRGRVELIEDPKLIMQVREEIAAKTARLSGRQVEPRRDEAAERHASKRVMIRFHPEKYASWDHSKIASSAH